MITIIKEENSVVIFSVRKYNPDAVYSVELVKIGNNVSTTIFLSTPEVYSGRALKFIVDLSGYKEGSYNYKLFSDSTEVDFGDFYIKDLNENTNLTYL